MVDETYINVKIKERKPSNINHFTEQSKLTNRSIENTKLNNINERAIP